MNLPKTLKNHKEKVDSILAEFFEEKIAEAGCVNDFPKEKMKLLRNYTLRGGKRIRAALLYYGYRCFSDENEEAILRASAAVELIQSFLLIHDDIIDNDNLRRGGPTIHKAYEKIHKERYKRYDSTHFGRSMAILLGDLSATLANEILCGLDFNPHYKVNAMKKLNQSVREVIYGEALDVLSQIEEKVSMEDILLIHELKTATYTVEGPLHIGVILAGASGSDLKTLSDYAIPLGQAFQLQDDILGMFGSQEKIGKPVGSDLKEGKKTALILKALEKASPKQKNTILNALGNKEISASEIEEVRRVIVETGSLDYSKSLIRDLTNKAKKAIKNSNFKEIGKNFLLGIADYIATRDY
jgi:geranylgeranyl diphosphate synthase type I